MPIVSSRPELLGYDVIGTLGYGARSTIYAVRDKDDRPFALKRVVRNSAADQRYLDQAILEYDIARRFTHPSLRRIYKLIKVRKILRVHEIFVLMEMVEGRTLEQYAFKNMQDLCRISQQVALALHEMHEGGIVHCDIKPNNVIVMPNGVAKIIDFGQSCPIGTIKQRIQGTPDYIAPEQVRRRQITPATDVFNLGATLYWMLTGRHVPTLIPRDGKRSTSLKHETACPAPRDINATVPPAMSSLVMHCVATDPADRPQNMLALHERIAWAMTQISREQPATPDDSTQDSTAKDSETSSGRPDDEGQIREKRRRRSRRPRDEGSSDVAI